MFINRKPLDVYIDTRSIGKRRGRTYYVDDRRPLMLKYRENKRSNINISEDVKQTFYSLEIRLFILERVCHSQMVSRYLYVIYTLAKLVYSAGS